ncbi:hypothetical protein LTS08_001600 [Lithohypha guttulata]|uniref:uncharacterized protein n=1 Tax=Lithohypha guttulata TaxID=1690604 RepID=UPI002DDFCC49|nr:hypothetical protein LTR51_003733 [Lithohypha guttulata]KAK5105323.1 hypothetical protein LTS08_001600 [Lithohypha guttulata]
MATRHASRTIIDAVPLSQPKAYICRQCRKNLRPSQVVFQQRRYASKKAENDSNATGDTWTEKIRSKLWQGKPPGPENIDDVYGGPGFFATMAKERKEKKQRAARQARQQAGLEEAKPELDSQRKHEVERKSEQLSAEAQQRVVRAEQETEVEALSASSPARPSQVIEDQDEGETVERTWLPVVGYKGDWRELRDMNLPMNRADEYNPWLKASDRPNWTYNQLVSLFHRAIVEVSACHLHAIDSTTSTGIEEHFERAKIEFSNEGTPVNVHIPHSAESATAKKPNTKRFSSSTEQSWASLYSSQGFQSAPTPESVYTPADTSFLNSRLSLQNKIVFQILQYFSTLTRWRIPDPILNDLNSADPDKNTIGHFLQSFANHTKAKPINLAEQLLGNEILAEHGNLLVLGRRETPVDREKEVGRWKLIEAELKARGLPVLGKRQVQY